MHDDKLARTATTESTHGRNPFVAWILAFVVPGVVVFLIRQAVVQQEQQRQAEQRQQEIRAFLESTPPEQMGPATRMLMGIDDPPAKNGKPDSAENPAQLP